MNFIFNLIASYAIPTILLAFLLLLIFVFSYFVVYKKIYKGEKKLTVQQIILFILIIGYYS
ncbi:VanZ family protein, partial [Bacillus cereus]|nr:VanZ family protein [Bacillus cereus]